jgi:NAD+ diphosphatase
MPSQKESMVKDWELNHTLQTIDNKYHTIPSDIFIIIWHNSIIAKKMNNGAAYIEIGESRHSFNEADRNEAFIPFIFTASELQLTSLLTKAKRALIVGKFQTAKVITISLSPTETFPDFKDYFEIPLDNIELTDLRRMIDHAPNEWIMLGAIALQIVVWDRKHTYCGQCGMKFSESTTEFAKVCSKCQNILYPQLAPAVIVAITKDEQILLARNRRFSLPIYSILAGFVNVGETLEEAIQREILEEAGLEVEKIKYFGSQPWPFPNSLMLGFTAKWKAGEISVDNEEITEAAWYSRDCLPKIPSTISIARKLIDNFLSTKEIN